jgi:adenylosuccinate synthase
MVDTVFPEVINKEGVAWDVLDPESDNGLTERLFDYVRQIEGEAGAPVRMIATSPTTVLWRP